ncbi:PHP domain-containing protein [Fusobacterium sp.]|uniref:PHP domain-containing protein n=1 Tax=Fusobacterium sp. TaxID=68766 RepID=UPI00262E947A|nr:PHP domain-containing protein [Fusobacterium sp.]
MCLNDLNDFLKNFYTDRKKDKTFIDLHLHTTYSDGFISGKSLVHFLRDKNYLIAVTDHNAIGGNILLRKLGINVVPGIELGCCDGFELLVYFASEDDMIYFYKGYVEPNKNKIRMAKTTKDIEYYLRALENFKCYKSIPHIAGVAQKNFIKNKDYIYNVIGRVDAIEIHNHALPKSRNLIAQEVQERYNLEITFGSDSHFMNEIKTFYEYFNEIENRKSLVNDYFQKMKLLSGLGQKHLIYGLKGTFEK